MNRENVQAAINIMKRAGQVNMVHWQSEWTTSGTPLTGGRFRGVFDARIATNEEEMHKCGNAACFGGWIAVSPEFQASGGHSWEGAPSLKANETDVGAEAIAEWLDIPNWLARCFVHGNVTRTDDSVFSLFYEKEWRDVNKEDVIAKLELLLAGELE